MASIIRITNSAGRDGSVQAALPAREPEVTTGLPGHTVTFRRYLAATEASRGDALAARLGEDYAQALIDGDPEVDMEHVGRTIGDTNTVYLTAKGEFLHSPPSVVEVITAADGSEKERRAPVDIDANIDDEHPVRWTGRKFPIADAVRRFVFRRSLQVLHVDGVTSAAASPPAIYTSQRSGWVPAGAAGHVVFDVRWAPGGVRRGVAVAA